MLRTVLAPNASALTLDGTRTYIVGQVRVAIIDPGSAGSGHLEAIVRTIGDAEVVAILVTHAHSDHVDGADELAEHYGAPVRMEKRRTLCDGAATATDAGGLLAVVTPGHTTDHVAFHWPAESAVFCGDLMMGGEDTALVAPPEGRLGPYLASLERIRALKPRVIYPGHGPAFQNPDQALDRYVRHRELRLEQVMRALGSGAATPEELVTAVYGSELEPVLRAAAVAALKAYLEYLQGQGRIRRSGGSWELTRR